MSRDYAKNSNNKPQREPIPGWAWMGGGLVIGLFVAGLVYLNEHTPKKNQQLLTNAVKRTLQDAQNKAQEEKTNSDNKRPRFDFYTILPELEVAIPDQELTSTNKKTHKTDQATSNTVTTSPVEAKGSFTLQAGSFRQREQADSLKAKLALQGVIADIQTVTINDGDTWHRVRIGPSHDLTELNRTRKRLSAIGVATIVVRNKN